MYLVSDVFMPLLNKKVCFLAGDENVIGDSYTLKESDLYSAIMW